MALVPVVGVHRGLKPTVTKLIGPMALLRWSIKTGGTLTDIVATRIGGWRVQWVETHDYKINRVDGSF